MLIGSIVRNNTAGGGGIYNNTPAESMILADSAVCGNSPDQIFGPWTDDGGNVVTTYCPPCPSTNLNGDSFVDAADLAQLLGNWGACVDPCEPGDPGETCPADFDGDCEVAASDLAQLLGSWGPCP